MITRILLLLTILCSLSAHAQQQATPVTGDTRLVTFKFDPDKSYLILTRPKSMTHVQLRPDEKIITVGAGDTANFIFTVTANKSNLLVRPKYPDMETSLTLITTERSYPIMIRSTDPEGGKWHQRVSWIVEEGLIDDSAAPVAPMAARATQEPLPDAIAAVPSALAIDRLNFDYAVEGDAPFKPVQVFDDGKHTYLRLPDALEMLPALFAVVEGEAQLLNYTVKNKFLVVQGTSPTMLLKLGKAEVKVRKGRTSRWMSPPWEVTGG